MTNYGFIRVSTGSQDAQTQRRTIIAAYPGAVIITTDTKAASASRGEQLDAIDALIPKLCRGDRIIVTDSSRLDRRENLDDQVQTVMAIKATGATLVSLAPGEEQLWQGGDLGSWITTLVKQNMNAEKSRQTKSQVHRAMTLIAGNSAHHGSLPFLWKAKGQRYAKKAVCTDPDSVKTIYTRVASGESISAIGRDYGTHGLNIKRLIKWEPNLTGVIKYHYETEGMPRLEWTHQVTPIISADLWWSANRILGANLGDYANKGGRPVGRPENWLTGILKCPGCGGRLYVYGWGTRAPKLRCVGKTTVDRRSCGKFGNPDAKPIAEMVAAWFVTNPSEVLAYKRIAGNQHVLDALRSELQTLEAQPVASIPKADRATFYDRLDALQDQISAFTLIPDAYDYAPTGQTIASMWDNATPEGKRALIKAVADNGTIDLFQYESQWLAEVTVTFKTEQDPIVNLGAGLCFRRPIPDVFDTIDNLDDTNEIENGNNMMNTTCARPGCTEELSAERQNLRFCTKECKRQHGIDVAETSRNKVRLPRTECARPGCDRSMEGRGLLTFCSRECSRLHGRNVHREAWYGPNGFIAQGMTPPESVTRMLQEP